MSDRSDATSIGVYLDDKFDGLGRLWIRNYKAAKFTPIFNILEADIASKDAFLSAVSILLTRPNSVSKAVFSARKFAIFCVKPSIQDDPVTLAQVRTIMLHPFTQAGLDFIRSKGIRRIKLVRLVAYKDLTHGKAEIYENWNFDPVRPRVHYFQVQIPVANSRWTIHPKATSLVCELSLCVRGEEEQYSVQFFLRGNHDSPTDQYWVGRYQDYIFKKFAKWANLPLKPEHGPGPLISLEYICHDQYQLTYHDMKEKYMKNVQDIWTTASEKTDPAKFIPEDLAIATYVKVLQTESSLNISKKFVDLGCGNGLLSHMLTGEGWTGHGLDLRRRNLWAYFPHMEEKFKVFDIRSEIDMKPFADENTLLIGNHPDEITPWIPIIARSTNSPFLIIPCCTYDFNGKYKRQNLKPRGSVYANYMEYLVQLCKTAGFNCRIEKLRIPSTKRLAILGIPSPEWDDSISTANLVRFLIGATVALQGRTSSEATLVKARAVKNCTSLPKDEVAALIKKIFDLLLETATDEDKTYPIPSASEDESSSTWNRGCQTVSLEKLVKDLGPKEMKLLKSQDKGIQTLLRNHKHIFKIEESCVRLRLPWDCTAEAKKKSVDPSKLKTKPCYFDANHPQNCPLKESECAFYHHVEALPDLISSLDV